MYHKDRMQRATILKQRALEIGFDPAGIAPLSIWEDLGFSRRWVEQGYGGEMRYLDNPKRDDPRRILPSVKSVVCVGLVYNAPFPYSTEISKKSEAQRVLRRPVRSPEASSDPELRDSGLRDSERAWISRYAWGRDYHEVMRARLEKLRAVIEAFEPGVETRVYVDTGPVVERAFARYSGIGWTGKNTCLINEAKGSWFFIGVVLTSLELEPDLPAPDFQPLEVKPPDNVSSFSLFSPQIEALASLTEDDFRRIFPHSPIKRAKFRGWLRTLCVAMGNSGAPGFVPWLERARQHSDAV